MYGGIKYWKEQHTFNPLAQHNQQNIQGRTYTQHCIGTYLRHTIGTTTGGITSMPLQHHQHLHNIGTCKPFTQDTIGTAPSAQHTIGTIYYWHITLATQHTIGTMYMILSQSFAGKCKIYLCSNSSMLLIYINSKSIYNCRGWQH